VEVTIGIDPGYRYIGIAAVGHPAGQPPQLLAATVVDLQGTGDRKHIADLLAGRAAHRRLRRTLKARRRRAAQIRAKLRERGYSEDTIAAVVALTRRRGFRPDMGQVASEKVVEKADLSPQREISERVWAALADIRVINPALFASKRAEAVRLGWAAAKFESKVDQAATDAEAGERRVHRMEMWREIEPRLHALLHDDAAVQDVRRVFFSSSKSHGLENHRVGRCRYPVDNQSTGVPRACGDVRGTRTVVGWHYPVLWLSLGLLQELPARCEKSRRTYIRQLAKAGYRIGSAGQNYRRFRCRTQKAMERGYELVVAAWKAAVAQGEVPENIQSNVQRKLEDAKKQLHGERAQTRVAFCAAHLREAVLLLARRGPENVPQLLPPDKLPPSVVWDAVATKVAVFVRKDVLPRLPDGATVTRVVAERDAFDLLLSTPAKQPKSNNPNRKRKPRPTPAARKVADQLRWLGPYGQLAKVSGLDHSDTNGLLSWEVGDLCALCGEPLGSPSDVDAAHLVPRATTGGYPYVGVVAAHRQCNARMGNSVAKIAQAAVLAMEQRVEEIEDRHGVVHPWITAKLHLLQVLVPSEEHQTPTEEQVTAWLNRIYSTSQATMQSTDRIQNAVAKALQGAGHSVTTVRRAASEVARARFVACPWFFKADAKAVGDVTNHALDAYILASLPTATRIGFSRGRPLYGILPQQLAGLVPIQSQVAWDMLVRQTWVGGDPGEQVGISDITTRRVWRQAFARDTQLGQQDGHRVYRQRLDGPDSWLGKLSEKKSLRDIRGHIEAVVWRPLREAALQALEMAERTSPDVNSAKDAVKTAVISHIRAAALRGLKGAQAKPISPTRRLRLERLRRWALEEEQTTPEWLGLRVVDRYGGGNAARIQTKTGWLNLETWACNMRISATTATGATHLWFVAQDGTLLRRNGDRKEAAVVDTLISDDLVRVVQKHRPALPPFLRAWQQEAARLLRGKGYTAAHLLSGGSTRGIALLR